MGLLGCKELSKHFGLTPEDLEICIINVELSALTQREQQVLAMIGRGYSIPKIAEKLFRSQKTIETHRQSLGRKLGVSNRVELARIAIQVGLAPLDLGDLNLADPPGSGLPLDDPAMSAVSRIESACAAVVDMRYARMLVKHLSGALDVTGAALLYCDDEVGELRSVAMWAHDSWRGAAVLDAKGVPCELTMDQGFFRCIGQVGELYPRFNQQLGLPIQSYMGMRLVDALNREPLGSLIVLQERSTAFVPITEKVLRVCAVRATAELERMRLIDSLQRSVESLEQRLAVLEGPEETADDSDE